MLYLHNSIYSIYCKNCDGFDYSIAYVVAAFIKRWSRRNRLYSGDRQIILFNHIF